jgi:hypothetical protein
MQSRLVTLEEDMKERERILGEMAGRYEKWVGEPGWMSTPRKRKARQ